MENSSQKVNNLEYEMNKIAFEIVNERILDENEINKLLGVLANDGVYAMWIYCKSKKINNIFIEKIKPLMKCTKTKLNDNIDYETYFQNISKNINDLSFFKEILEKTLIYARYHAKALGD